MNKTIPSQALRRKRLEANPTCSHCGKTKTVADFPGKGVDYWCTECRNAYSLKLYHKRRAELSPEELVKLRAKVNERQNVKRAERLARMTPEASSAYKAKLNAENVKRRESVRDSVYRAYGGYVCACCGENEKAFLSIDHVNNDGADHKRLNRLHTGEQMYRWIIRNGFPKGFQILCMNCNWGKHRNNGVCPHQGRCNDYPEREYGQATGSATPLQRG
jgi:hypothetical protein